MYIVDLYLIPLCLCWINVILCTCAYCDTHEGIISLMFIWVLTIIATILYVLRRKAYKENKKA